jgi:septal ring factor EnvC (AmiA/AmiB activator)
MKKLLLFISLCLFFSVTFAKEGKKDIIDQQKEMQKIQTEIKDNSKKLDSLKTVEIKIQKQLSDSDQKISTNKKVIGRLNRELRQLRNNISSTEDLMDKQQVELTLKRRRYLGNIRQFYMVAHKDITLFSEDPNEELRLNRQIRYLTSISEFESGNIRLATQYLEGSHNKMNQLSGESKKISKLKQKKETSTSLAVTRKRKLDRNLAQVKRKKSQAADQILMLEQAAKEMENIISRLQDELERKASKSRDDDSPTFFTALKGQLLSPYRGKVIESFGYKVDKVTNLKSFTPGIMINGGANQNVLAVASGTIAYVGELRGYGNFIIINHDDRHYTTYAGLGQTFVSAGEYVLAGKTIAKSDLNGKVKFELRKGTKPLDPVEWIKIDAF